MPHCHRALIPLASALIGLIVCDKAFSPRLGLGRVGWGWGRGVIGGWVMNAFPNWTGSCRVLPVVPSYHEKKKTGGALIASWPTMPPACFSKLFTFGKFYPERKDRFCRATPTDPLTPQALKKSLCFFCFFSRFSAFCLIKSSFLTTLTTTTTTRRRL